MSRIVIPGMAMPSIFAPLLAALWLGAACEWQSESARANAQESSHAAARGVTDRSRATIEPAKMHLILISISMLRQFHSFPQSTL